MSCQNGPKIVALDVLPWRTVGSYNRLHNTTGKMIMNHAVSPSPSSSSSRDDCAKNRSSISYEIETTIPQSVRVLKLLESDLEFAKKYVSSLLAKLRKTSGLLLQRKRNFNEYGLSIQNLIPS